MSFFFFLFFLNKGVTSTEWCLQMMNLVEMGRLDLKDCLGVDAVYSFK